MNAISASDQNGALRTAPPVWYWGVAGFGLVWNAYGVFQFAKSLSATVESLMAEGLTQPQAELYLGLPAWMNVVFATGVFAALVGSVLLLARKKQAQPVLLVSLVGYVLLFAGDFYYGVFVDRPAQFAILAFVVAFAAALLWVARHFDRRGVLV